MKLSSGTLDLCIFYTVLKPQIYIASTQHTATCPTFAQYCYWAVSSTKYGVTGFIRMLTYLFYLTFQNSSVLAYMRMDSKWSTDILPYNLIVHSFYKADQDKIFLPAIISAENVAGTFRITNYSFRNTNSYFVSRNKKEYFSDLSILNLPQMKLFGYILAKNLSCALSFISYLTSSFLLHGLLLTSPFWIR